MRGGTFPVSPNWSAELADKTYAIALGDINGDGNLDLVCGNTGRNSLYMNNGEVFSTTPDWFSIPEKPTNCVALGDVDNDGDLDLVCGNDGNNTLYTNEGGILSSAPSWSSIRLAYTQNIVLEDIDGDGDLDIVCGNCRLSMTQYNTLYLNEGGDFPASPVFLTGIKDISTCIVLGDVDKDGDLDLVCGNDRMGNTLHRGTRNPLFSGDPLAPSNHLPNSSAFVESFSVQYQGVNNYSLSLTLVDVESDPAWIIPQYRYAGSPIWHSLDLAGYQERIGPLSTSPPGDVYQFAWNTLSLSLETKDVILRIRTLSNPTHAGSSRYIPSCFMNIGTVESRRPELEHPIGTIEFPAITVGDTASTAIAITNSGNETLSIASFALPSSEMWIIPDAPIELPPSETVIFTSYYSPLLPQDVAGELLITSNDPFHSEIRIPLIASARPLNFSLVNLYPDGILDQGEGLNASIVMQDSTSSDSALVYYRNAGEMQFNEIRMDKIADQAKDQYFIFIPPDSIGLSGVEFFPAVYNRAATYGELQRLRLRAANIPFPFIQPELEYRMISIPLEMQGTIYGTISDDLGGREITTWRMYVYECEMRIYTEIPNEEIFSFVQGQSYWLISRESNYVDTGPTYGLTAHSDSSFYIMIEPGWNMIGNPFNFPVAWDSCMVDTFAMAEAGALVEPPVGWIFGQGYQQDVEILHPFEGYWVKNLHTSDVVLKVPPRGTSTAISVNAEEVIASSPGNNASGNGWRIKIIAQSARAMDQCNEIGVDARAGNQWDRRDRSEPPMSPGHSISLYFPHNSWDRHPGNYTSDIRGEYEPLQTKQITTLLSNEEIWGHLWHFDVAKNFSDESAGDEVILEFINLGNIPSESAVYLVDRHLQKLVDLRAKDSYRFYLGQSEFVPNEEDARFVLLVGSEEFVGEHKDELPKPPVITRLYQNYPNPFNPSTVIRYDIAEAGYVELKIYDARGALVKTLYQGTGEPGRYEVIWNGKNDKGISVSSGIFFSMMKAGNLRQIKKVVLLR